MFHWPAEDKVILPVLVVGMELTFTHFLDDLVHVMCLAW